MHNHFTNRDELDMRRLIKELGLVGTLQLISKICYDICNEYGGIHVKEINSRAGDWNQANLLINDISWNTKIRRLI